MRNSGRAGRSERRVYWEEGVVVETLDEARACVGLRPPRVHSLSSPAREPVVVECAAPAVCASGVPVAARDAGAPVRRTNRRRTACRLDGSTNERSLSVACMECAGALCIAVCPAACFRRAENGMVLHAKAGCIGCSYCFYVCPCAAPPLPRTRGRHAKDADAVPNSVCNGRLPVPTVARVIPAEPGIDVLDCGFERASAIRSVR